MMKIIPHILDRGAGPVALLVATLLSLTSPSSVFAQAPSTSAAPGANAVFTPAPVTDSITSPMPSDVGATSVNRLGWTIIVQNSHQMAASAGLVSGAVKIILQHLVAGDNLHVLTVADAPKILFQGTVVTPQQVQADVLQRLSNIPYSSSSVRLGEALQMAYHMAPSIMNPDCHHALILVTDGHPRVPTGHESEMRLVSDMAGKWRSLTNNKSVIAGIITEEDDSHWLLYRLQKQTGAELTLVRSASDGSVEAAFQDLERSITGIRRASPHPSDSPVQHQRTGLPLYWLIGAALSLAALIGYVVLHRGHSSSTAPIFPAENEGLLAGDTFTSRLVMEIQETANGVTSTPRRRDFSPMDLASTEGRVSIGSGMDAAVRLSHPGILPIHFVIHVESSRMDLELPEGATVSLLGEVLEGPALHSCYLPSVSTQIGPYTIRVHRMEVNHAPNFASSALTTTVRR